MSRDAAIAPGKVVIDCDLDASPEKVWRALTEPELVAAWLTEGDIGEKVRVEILAEGPGREISYGWRENAEESVVTFAVSETPSGGAHLRLVHQYFGDMKLISSPVFPSRAMLRKISIVSPKYPRRRVRDKCPAPGLKRPTSLRWAA